MAGRISKSALRIKVLHLLRKALPILPGVLLVVGCLLLAALPAADTRVNVQDEGNLRARGYRSKVEGEDLGLGRDALSSIPSAYMRSVVLDGSSTIDVIEVPGSRAPGTEHFVVISTGPSHEVAMALAHSFAHQPFMSMDLRFYLAPPSVEVDDVIQAAGLPVGMIRGGLQLNLSSSPAGISSICVHTFGVGALQPNQDLLNVFTVGLRVHGLASDFLCHTNADSAIFAASTMAWDEWVVEAGMAVAGGGGVPQPLQQWLTGALQTHVVPPLSEAVHEGFEAIGGSPRRAGNMRLRVSHMMLYGLEMLRNDRIGQYGGGGLRTSFGLHTLGISDYGADAAPLTSNTQSSLRIARGVEYGIRSINNLDERLHHSSPAWLSSSTNTFSDFSVGQAVSFVFTAGCIAVLLGAVLQVPVGDLLTPLLYGMVSMLIAIAAVQWVCIDFELTPVLWAIGTTVIYFITHAFVGVVTATSAPSTTRHFPLLVMLAMLCTGLVFMLVGLHPVLSMFGGGVLLGQLLMCRCVSQGGVSQQHQHPPSNIGKGALRVLTWGLLSLCMSALSIIMALVMSVLLDGDGGTAAQVFILLSTQLAIVTCFATLL